MKFTQALILQKQPIKTILFGYLIAKIRDNSLVSDIVGRVVQDWILSGDLSKTRCE